MSSQPCSETRWLAALALTLSLGLLAACGGDDAPGDASVRQSIGAAGGSLSSAGGAMSLTIPAGALGTETEIVITEVSAANQSDAVRALGAEKVYQLEPAGLQFGQPVAVTVALPPSPSGNIAIALLHSDGAWETLQAASQVVSATGRTLSGQLTHFTDLALKEVGVRYTADVAPREIEVGQSLTTLLRIVNDNAPAPIEIELGGPLESSPFIEVEAANSLQGAPKMRRVSADERGSSTLPRVGAMFEHAEVYECLQEHEGSVWFRFNAVFPDPSFLGVLLSLRERASVSVSWSSGYVCKGTTAPPPDPIDAIRTGLFPLPLGMQQPDGIQLVQRAFAGLAGNTVHALIAGSNGVVSIDLKTGDVSLNQTASGPDGQLGTGGLLGVTAVSQPNPGATTHAGLFGAGALGSAARSYVQFNSGAWGWSQILLIGQVLQWASSGGSLEADEVLAVRPDVGLVSSRFDGVAYRQSAEGSVDAFRFDGKLVGAAVPLNLAGSPVLAVTHTDGDTTTSVWHHDRSRTPGALLFKVPGMAKVLRCMDQALSTALGSRRLCGMSTDDALFYWQYDTQDPAAVPSVSSVPVGSGAVGVQFGLRATNKPRAAVANYGGDSVSIFDFDDTGRLVDRQDIAVPAGCVNPAHGAPFNHAGKDYVVATCFGSAGYVVLPVGLRY